MRRNNKKKINIDNTDFEKLRNFSCTKKEERKKRYKNLRKKLGLDKDE